MNYELELYKLIIIPDEDDTDISYVDEFGWVNNEEFYIWVNFLHFNDFMDRLRDIFGCGIYGKYGIDVNIQDGSVCIDLQNVLGGYVNLENVFPKYKYNH